MVAIFCQKMLTGEQAIINGDGKNSRDYVFVEDVVRANVLALRDDCNGIYNIGTTVENDVNYIFSTLRSLLNVNMQEHHGTAKAGEQRRSVITSEKLFKDFNWKPQVQFNDGLSQTAEYFRLRAGKI